MSTFNVATRYAKALVELAEEKNNFSSVSDDAELVFNTISASKELRNVLLSPVIKLDKKKDIVSAVFSGKVGKDTEEFLLFLVSKKRADIVREVFGRFLELRNEKLGYVDVSVTSAANLDEKQKARLNSVFSDLTKKQVNLDFDINENIIGGFVAQYGDTLIDASVKNQLNILKKKLLV